MITRRFSDVLAQRFGAASIYLVLGMAVGLVAAVVLLAALGKDQSPSFASVVFGVSALSAGLAALFPRIAMESISSLGYLAWGLVNGTLVPWTGTTPEADASRHERAFFWAGFVVGCALLISWLIWRRGWL